VSLDILLGIDHAVDRIHEKLELLHALRIGAEEGMKGVDIGKDKLPWDIYCKNRYVEQLAKRQVQDADGISIALPAFHDLVDEKIFGFALRKLMPLELIIIVQDAVKDIHLLKRRQ